MRSKRSRDKLDWWLGAAHAIGRRRPPVVAGGLLTVAGLTVAFAVSRSALRRRSMRIREAPEGRPTQRRSESLTAQLRRAILAQLERAIDALEAGDPDAIHEMRKALKRTRALLRLVRGEFGAPGFKRENAALRECSRRLADARDAQVMLATLEDLLERQPKKLASVPVVRLKAHLHGELERSELAIAATGETRQRVLGQLREIHERIQAWEPRDGAFELIEGELETIYRRGRTSFRRARKRTDADSMHAWRRRVKDLRYVAEALGAKEAQPTKRLRRVERVAERAKEVGELIGEEHDLVLLADRVRDRRALFEGHGRSRKTLMREIKRRRRRLRRQALRGGERLYRRTPRELTRTFARAQGTA